MADKRFRWKRYPLESVEAYESRIAEELKRRGVKRAPYPKELEKRIKCLIGCHKVIRPDDQVYAPTRHPGPDNKSAAHVECVDSFVSDFKAKLTKEMKTVEAKKLEAKGILHVPVKAKPSRPAKTKPVVPSLPVKSGGNGNPGYDQGWRVGVRYSFERVLIPAVRTDDPEWMRGFCEGIVFGSEHSAPK